MSVQAFDAYRSVNLITEAILIEEPDIMDVSSNLLYPTFPYMQSFSNNMRVLNPRNSMILPESTFASASFQNNCGSYEEA